MVWNSWFIQLMHEIFSNILLNSIRIFCVSQLPNAENTREILFASFSGIRRVTTNFFKLHVLNR